MKEHIKENLKKLPNKPGVYIHRDKMGQIIYVGKAISLKKRVSQYFQPSKNMDNKVKAMVDHIADFEYILCENEMEAFILENNLIKENRPKYNILLRDDKTYPYIHVTLDETWPRIVKTRILGEDKGKYFGPYSDVTSLNVMIDFLNDVFVLKHCATKKFKRGAKPCLNYHIGKCQGICIGGVDRKDYMERINAAMAFLSGRDKSLINHLKEKMKEASSRMDYEEAAKYRDYVRSAQSLLDRQRVDFKKNVDMDAVLPVGESHVALFAVREGKLAGRETFEIQSQEGYGPKEKIGEFLKQYYSEMPSGPSEIIVSDEPEDKQLIESFLGNLWGRKVTIHQPKKGEKKALLDLTINNRDEMLKTMEDRDGRIKKKNEKISQGIYSLIKDMDGWKDIKIKSEFRVEAYDISNTNGIDTVAAMVVFNGMKTDKKSYRRFKVRTSLPGDDYASMQEVIYRRLKRGKEKSPGFDRMPDLIILDGGKGHLNAVLQIMEAMKIDIPVAGAVKDDKHRTRGLVYLKEGKPFEMDLKESPILFSYIGTIQEEVHRFAIDYHRKVRDSFSLASVLDEIPGIGKVKRNALLGYFENIDNIAAASEEELQKADGITKSNAKAIKSFFEKEGKATK